MSGRRLTAWIGTAALVVGTTAILPTGVASAAPAALTRSIPAGGSASFANAGVVGPDGSAGPEFLGQGPTDAGQPPFAGTITDRSRSPRDERGGDAQGGRREGRNPQLNTSFNGLTMRDQRLANGGNQFSVEPPDQGMCAGNGFVLESVNDVLNVYDQAGTSKLGVTDLNTFYGYPAQIVRPAGPFGPSVTDPSCLFDSATQRWFQVVLTLDTDPATGALTGRNTIDVAVSKAASPLAGWTIYHVPVTDDGTDGTPDHHCGPGTPPSPTHPNACIGDYPHIGADANGFFVTTNEYDLFGPNFHAAQVYAFSKAALARSATSVAVTQIDTVGLDRGNPGFTLFPAGSPGRESFERAAGGTEYLMSSNAAQEANGTGASSDLLVWSLTNTRSLDTPAPAVALDHTVVGVNPYAIPPLSDQKPGDFPLGQCINDTTTVTPASSQPGCWRALFAAEPAHNEVETRLDSSDTRMHQVVFAAGKLWGALDTALTLNGVNKAGIEWFAVTPRGRAGSVSARVARAGYLGLANNNLTYPAIGMTEEGKGVMAFSLMGADHYPSAAYAPIGESGVGDVHVIAEGAGPADGFTGYKALVGDPPRPRWGDYGASATDGRSVWLASEYTGQSCTLAQYVTSTPASPLFSCGRTRVTLGNWYTRISKLTP